MRQFALLDVTTSDYFRGYHLPVLSVIMIGEVLHSELAEELKNEFEYSYELFSEIEDFESLMNEYINSLLKEPNAVFYEADEYFGDFDENEYAYFSIINPKVVNGITFLD